MVLMVTEWMTRGYVLAMGNPRDVDVEWDETLFRVGGGTIVVEAERVTWIVGFLSSVEVKESSAALALKELGWLLASHSEEFDKSSPLVLFDLPLAGCLLQSMPLCYTLLSCNACVASSTLRQEVHAVKSPPSKVLSMTIFRTCSASPAAKVRASGA